MIINGRSEGTAPGSTGDSGSNLSVVDASELRPGQSLGSVENDFSPRPSDVVEKNHFDQQSFLTGQKSESAETKKLRLVEKEFRPVKNSGEKSAGKGQKGRPRRGYKPPTIAKYLYWKPNSYGFSLERKHPKLPYEYFGFLLPRDWEYMKGIYDENQIITAIRAILKIKRLRTLQRRKNSGGTGRTRQQSGAGA